MIIHFDLLHNTSQECFIRLFLQQNSLLKTFSLFHHICQQLSCSNKVQPCCLNSQLVSVLLLICFISGFQLLGLTIPSFAEPKEPSAVGDLLPPRGLLTHSQESSCIVQKNKFLGFWKAEFLMLATFSQLCSETFLEAAKRCVGWHCKHWHFSRGGIQKYFLPGLPSSNF